MLIRTGTKARKNGMGEKLFPASHACMKKICDVRKYFLTHTYTRGTWWIATIINVAPTQLAGSGGCGQQ
jgi:hypothetical protein